MGKRRMNMYVVGELAGGDTESFCAALKGGNYTTDAAQALRFLEIKQMLIGDDRVAKLWGFDVFVNPDNPPVFWNA